MACGLPESAAELLETRLAGLPLLQGPPEQAHFRALLAEAYRQSWFVAPGAASLAIAFRGARPGTPLADAIFVFVIAELIAKVHAKLMDLGMDLQLRPTDPITLQQDPAIPPITRSLPPGAAYADDTASGLIAESSEIIDNIPAICAAILDGFGPLGPKYNMGPKKTALLLAPHGKGAGLLRQQVWHARNNSINLVLAGG